MEAKRDVTEVREKQYAGTFAGATEVEVSDIADYYLQGNPAAAGPDDVYPDARDILEDHTDGEIVQLLRSRVREDDNDTTLVVRAGREDDPSIGKPFTEIVGTLEDYEDGGRYATGGTYRVNTDAEIPAAIEALAAGMVEYSVSSGAHIRSDYALRKNGTSR